MTTHLMLRPDIMDIYEFIRLAAASGGLENDWTKVKALYFDTKSGSHCLWYLA
jgi:hypothetical protein